MGLLRLDRVRGIVDSNVSNLSSFTVAANDGITYVQGDFLALVLQTTAAQCGLYVCGAVSGGTCALTRAYGWESGVVFTSALAFTVGHEGTAYGGTTWWSTANGTIGTNDPVFYPEMMMRTVTFSSGLYTLGSAEKLWLFSTTKSGISFIRNTLSGTSANTGLATSARTAGKVGTASLAMYAMNTTNATATGDNSTYDITVTNFL